MWNGSSLFAALVTFCAACLQTGNIADELRHELGCTPVVPHLSVSTVIPSYNRASLLQRALASVVPECVQGDEIIVVDDGSTDETEALVRGYGPPVRYMRIARAGAGAARNAGVRAATGDLVAFLDSDDEWMPGRLLWQRAVMEQRPDVLFLFSDFGSVTKAGERLHHVVDVWKTDPRPWDEILGPGIPSDTIAGMPASAPSFQLHVGSLYENYVRNWCVSPITVVVRREKAGDALWFAEDLPAFEDVECLVRLAARGHAGFVDCETAWQHVHRGPRLTDILDELRTSEVALTILARTYGSDTGFLQRHRDLYESVMDQHRDRAVRELLWMGRSREARREIGLFFRPRPALFILSHLPGSVVRSLLASRRRLRSLRGERAGPA